MSFGRTNASVAEGLAAELSNDALCTTFDTHKRPRYGACGYSWHGLDMKDFGMLSLAAYFSPTAENDLDGLLKQLLTEDTKVTIKKAMSAPRKWLELEVETCMPRRRGGGLTCRSVTVVSVGGTDPSKVQDILENIRMWTEPVVMEIFSVIFPVVRFWPRETSANVIGTIHRIIKWMAVQDDQWHYQEILDHVRQLPTEQEVVITGHSLGGGIALVVGALSGRQVVAIQPPGLYHALAKHQEQHRAEGFGRELHQNSVSLIVEGDPVSNFDGHGGLVQTMHCDADTAMGCHMIENTLCHLIHNCNDPDARFSTCKYEIPEPEESDPVPQPELKWRQLLAASIGFVGNNTRTYAVCVLGVIAVVWLVLVALEMRRCKRTCAKLVRDRREADGVVEKKACADIDSRLAAVSALTAAVAGG
mmetsp:Transcript_152343/g.486786  ORF Transcript_152343/g.486786 Transcript_152343/m.486786 type:complete len:418 (-) Transcript_152343:694-1947(-)